MGMESTAQSIISWIPGNVKGSMGMKVTKEN